MVPIGKINLSENDIIKWVDFTLNNPDGMFVRNRKNNGEKSNNIANNPNIGRLADGKYMIPTAGYYAKFVPSKVE